MALDLKPNEPSVLSNLGMSYLLTGELKQAETILDVDEDTAAALFRAVHRIARAIEKAYRPDGLTILQANRPAGFQTVPHVHLHILPRRKDDGVALTWPRKNPAIEELHRLAEPILKALGLGE